MIAIVIPNRTKRWFHQWTPEINLNAGSPALFPMDGETYQFPGELYGGGGSFTIRGDAGYYMGIPRSGGGVRICLQCMNPITAHSPQCSRFRENTPYTPPADGCAAYLTGLDAMDA